MKLSQTIISIFLFVTSANAIDTAWNYSDQEAWKTVENWQCDGKRQYPIDIITSNLIPSSDLMDLVLSEEFQPRLRRELDKHGSRFAVRS